MPSKDSQRQQQSLPLDAKVTLSIQRIREWYDYWNGFVYISFSGGKDSTVLAHIVHSVYPDVPLVFCDTGLEYPEIRKFASDKGAEFLRPRKYFFQTIEEFGYPIISKEVSNTIYYARKNEISNNTYKKRAELRGRYADTTDVELSLYSEHIHDKSKWLALCCDTDFRISSNCCSVMKKGPGLSYDREKHVHGYVGTLAEESLLREKAWVTHGCNSYDGKHKISRPLSFWTNQDILHYIAQNGIEICSVYGDLCSEAGIPADDLPLSAVKKAVLHCSGCERTGCMFCGFGLHLEKGETRFQRLARTHPKQYAYCLDGGGTSTTRTMTLPCRSTSRTDGRTGIRSGSGCRTKKGSACGRFLTK